MKTKFNLVLITIVIFSLENNRPIMFSPAICASTQAQIFCASVCVVCTWIWSSGGNIRRLPLQLATYSCSSSSPPLPPPHQQHHQHHDFETRSLTEPKAQHFGYTGP